MQTPGWEDAGSGWVRSLVFLGRGGGYSRVQCIVIIDSYTYLINILLHLITVQQKHSHMRHIKSLRNIWTLALTLPVFRIMFCLYRG